MENRLRNLNKLLGARTDNLWNSSESGSYIYPNDPSGFDLLIKGLNKYLNFGSTNGSSGYGFRDNSGTIQWKNSGGAWANVGSGGSGGASAFTDLTDVPNSYTGDGEKFVKVKATEDGLEFVAGSGAAVAFGDITGLPSDNTALNTALGDKVDVVAGKGLSTNDYTDAEKTKLAGIAAGATIGADWNTNILNKPSIPTKTSDLTNDSNFPVDASYVHTDNNYTSAEKTKLSGIAAGAEVNVNADWNSVSGDSQILNKPSIPTKTSDLTNDSNFPVDASYVHTDNNYTTAEKTKLSGIAAGAEVNVNADWNAVSGDAQILNKPTIPTALASLTDDSTHRLTTDTEKTTWNSKQAALGFTPEDSSKKGAASGYCGLDSNSKVPLGNIPDTLLGSVNYHGVYDASSGTDPTVAGGANKGDYFVISVAGAISGTAYAIGDWIIYNGTVWEKVDNTSDVSSVNTKTGAVVLTPDDLDDTASTHKFVSAAQITVINNTSGTNTGDQTLAGLGGVPTSRTVNTKALSANIVLSPDDLDDTSSTHKFVSSAQLTVINNTTGTNSGNENTTSLGTTIAGAIAKATPVDADNFGYSDSAASNVMKKMTWANIKSVLKTYFDTVYTLALLGGVPTTRTINTKALSADVTLTTADVADSADKRYCTDAQKTVIGNTSGTNSGNETTTTIGTMISGATAKATPVDADNFGYSDSAASNVLKKLTWANIKSVLKTYFDTVYSAINSLILVVSPSSDHTSTGITTTLTAGENIAQSEVVYFKSDGKVYKTDADAIATMPVIGLATAAISSAAAGSLLLHGIARDDTWAWTVGGYLYASGTAGAITQTQPSGTDGVIQVLGIALSATTIYFNPQLLYTTHV